MRERVFSTMLALKGLLLFSSIGFVQQCQIDSRCLQLSTCNVVVKDLGSDPAYPDSLVQGTGLALG